MLTFDAALLAFRDPVRAALLFDVFEAGIIIRKFAVKISHRIEPFFCDARSGPHVRLPEIPGVLPYLYSRDKYRSRIVPCDCSFDGSPADRTPTMAGSEMVASLPYKQLPEPGNYLVLHRPKSRGTL